MKNIIEIKNLVKTYDNFTLDNISLNIPKGAIIGLIGENGAGKTTLLKAILGIIKPNAGDIKIFSKEINDEFVKENIGVVLDDMFFPKMLKCQDIDNIMKSIYKNWDSPLFNKYLKDFHIEQNKMIKALSKGMRKKLEIATALSHHPKLLILDEPTSGLDPVVRNDVLTLFLDFIQDEEKSILFSTHITSDLEHIADEIILIENGKVIIDSNRDELFDNYGIIKCNEKDFLKIDKEDIKTYKHNPYNYEVLISDKKKIKKKYPKLIIDNITLDELMVLMIKGEK